MKRLPILIQLYLVLFAVLVIPLIVVLRVNTYTASRYYESEIAASAEKTLSSVQTLNETILQSLKLEMITLAKSATLENISEIKYLSPALANGDNFGRLKNVERLVYQTAYTNGRIFSIYVCIDGADYVISNREGILYTSLMDDAEFVKQYAKIYKDKSYDSQGEWAARSLPDENREIKAISYFYPLTSLTTSTRGFVIVNLYADKMRELLNSDSGEKNGETFILDKNGIVVAPGNSVSFLDNLSSDTTIRHILDEKASDGSILSGNEADKTLYIYSKDRSRGWTYVSRYSHKNLFEKINAINNTSLFLFVAIIGVGILLTFVILLRISKPLNNLIKTLKNREDLSLGNASNEMELLFNAFQQISDQEKELGEILKKKEADAAELFISDLLKGLVSKYTEASARAVFPHPHFIVIILSIDNAENFISRYTPEQRYYFRVMILTRLRETLDSAFVSRGVIYEGQSVALILNLHDYDSTGTPDTIRTLLERLQQTIKKECGLSTSAGIGGLHNELPGIRVSLSEAQEALKQKLLTGNESILFWKEPASENTRYFYPYNREKHILNCLQTRNEETLLEEVRLVVADIRESDGISCDNIMQIFSQLISSTIKYLVENNINLREIFGNIYSVYRKMAALDTLEAIEDYLLVFYRKIITYLSGLGGDEVRHIDKILGYINENYKKEINFEDMAESIGISYSYIRKIIKDVTDSNLIDYINSLRIGEAKRLLRATSMSVSEISAAVGYNNVQSLTRFFKKFEGIPPGEYRNISE